MNNTITTIIMLLSIFLIAVFATCGIKIGDFQILSISQLIEKNEEVDGIINKASDLDQINYPEAIQNFEETYEKFAIQKRKYDELTKISSVTQNGEYETKQYEVGYIWRILGNYAAKRGLRLGIDIQKSGIGNNLYNINFNVVGKYVKISQFIIDIENDSDLYFRIYNFKMENGEGEIEVRATFTVKNINLDPSTIL